MVTKRQSAGWQIIMGIMHPIFFQPLSMTPLTVIQALINYVDAQYNYFDAEMPAMEPKPSIMSQPVAVPEGPKGAENGKGQEEAKD